jgi:flagellar hook-associated protein 2
MSDPIGSVSGLASGIQWRDMVDQIIALDSSRTLTPVTDKKDSEQKRLDAWTQFSALVATFRDSVKGLRDGSTFGTFKVNAAASPASGRALVSATASGSATPGNYTVEVDDIARANKLSGNIVTSASTALGLSGEFAINGRVVTIAATDTLSQVRDKINAVNAGATPSGVSASVLSTGTSAQRLVLTSDSAGSSGIELVDGASGVLQSLGVIDGSTSLNLTSTGATQTYKVTSATAAIATMLGVSLPPPSTITINGQTITVDLTVDSLTSIAAKIQAAGGKADVVTETVNGKTGYRLVTGDAVGAPNADGQRTLEALGFVTGGRGAVSQVVQNDTALGDASSAQATASTLLSDLSLGGGGLGLVAGDTFKVQGTRGDGSAVSLSFTVGASDTVQTLLDKINDATSGFGAGSRKATASVVGGRIVVTDATGGDSQLSLSLTANRAAGGSVSLGRMAIATTGRARELVAGTDAKVTIDGVALTRSSNVITDAISGVTLNILNSEPGTTVDVTVARDTDSIKSSLTSVTKAYNALVKFVSDQQASGQPLASSSPLRSAMSSITNTLLADVPGATGSFKRTAVAGLSLQKDGTLALDNAMFDAALSTNYQDVLNLFQTSGTATNSEVTYQFSTDKTKAGTYAVNITQAATTASVLGTGFSGTYVDDGTPDTMSITDASTGVTGNIQLENGDTTADIVDKLNAMFGANKMNVTATVNGNNIAISGTQYGSLANITVAYAAGGTDGSAQLGIAAQLYAGLDVQGTIGGLPAIGTGRSLTGATGGVTDGLVIKYTGTAIGAMGTVTFMQGAAGGLFLAADAIARSGDGAIAMQQDAISRTITSLTTRADTIQGQLDRKKESLIAQFTAMEAAIAKIQTQGTAITNFITSMRAAANS